LKVLALGRRPSKPGRAGYRARTLPVR
jgi:hypothetical protein